MSGGAPQVESEHRLGLERRPGRSAAAVQVTPPASHLDLLERPLTAALATLLPDGQPQTHPVWFSFDGLNVLVNTMRGFRKERNMRADPRVTLLVVDPGSRVHWVELRGIVELTEGALHHLDDLGRRYTGAAPYFGEVVPGELAEREVPVIGRITPIRVVTDSMADARSARLQRRAMEAVVSPEGLRPTPDRPRATIPKTHRDVLERPLRAYLSTLMPDGHPQTQPIWCNYDGGDVLINTSMERQKGRNLLADRRATILIVDPDDTSRWIEVRGDVGITREGAIERLDGLARLYTGSPQFYGWVYPESRRGAETRITSRIHPGMSCATRSTARGLDPRPD